MAAHGLILGSWYIAEGLRKPREDFSHNDWYFNRGPRLRAIIPTSVPPNSFPYPQNKRKKGHKDVMITMIKPGRLGPDITRCSKSPTNRHTTRLIHTHDRLD